MVEEVAADGVGIDRHRHDEDQKGADDVQACVTPPKNDAGRSAAVRRPLLDLQRRQPVVHGTRRLLA